MPTSPPAVAPAAEHPAARNRCRPAALRAAEHRHAASCSPSCWRCETSTSKTSPWPRTSCGCDKSAERLPVPNPPPRLDCPASGTARPPAGPDNSRPTAKTPRRPPASRAASVARLGRADTAKVRVQRSPRPDFPLGSRRSIQPMRDSKVSRSAAEPRWSTQPYIGYRVPNSGNSGYSR